MIWNPWGKYSVVLFFGHILYYMFFSFYYFLQPYDAQSELLWTIPLLVDLPSSGILFVLCHCSFFFRIIAMGILGTLQYALIGRLIDRARDHQEKNKEKASENGTE